MGQVRMMRGVRQAVRAGAKLVVFDVGLGAGSNAFSPICANLSCDSLTACCALSGMSVVKVRRPSRANTLAIGVPMLIGQNPTDVIVSPAVTRNFALAACRSGTRLRYFDIQGGNHATSAVDKATPVGQCQNTRIAATASG